jgi:hypothetical protein
VKLSLRWVLFLPMLVCPAFAATLNVGPDQLYKLPSEAIRAAAPGDTIRIAPGNYADCAVWGTNDLTVEGTGAGPVLGGKICEDKGIFIIDAASATIRNITFAGATIEGGNGSGIRANGARLVVENSTFRNNQDGILTGNDHAGSLVVRNSTFEGNGACVPNEGCAHGIYAGHLGLVRIEGSHFFDTKVGHHIKSRAWRTELVGNTIEDGPAGTSSYLVDIPNGGTLVMTGNILEKGPNTENPTVAVSIGEETARRPSEGLVIAGNSFTNDGPATTFVRNVTKTPARLSGNTFKGHRIKPLSGPGTVD